MMSAKVANVKNNQLAVYISWVVALGMLALLIFYIAPRRGAGFVVDDGLFLSSAWSAAHGFGLDKMLPQEPTYLVQALLFKLGFKEYLHIRYFYYAVGFLGALIFFLGLDDLKLKSVILPLVTVASLFVAFSSILVTYQFFLIAAGCYFLSIDSKNCRNILLVFSGIFLAITGFMHVAFLIAMIIVLLLICFFEKTSKRYIGVSFLITSMLIWACYIYSLGLDNLLNTPAGHDASFVHLLTNIFKIIRYYIITFLLFLAGVYVFSKRGEGRYEAVHIYLSLCISIVYLLPFFIAQLLTILSIDLSRFGLVSANTYVENRYLRHIITSPGAIYALLLLSIYRLIAESNYLRNLNTLIHNSWYGFLRKCWISRNAIENRNKKIIVGIVGMLLIVCGYAVGSASSFSVCLSAFCGPIIGITFYSWHLFSVISKKYIYHFRIMALAWLSAFFIYALTINLPTFQSITNTELIEMTSTPLKGIYETPKYIESLNSLREIYRENKCDGLMLLTLDYLPTIYYVLGHPLPNDVGVIRPEVYYPEKQIIELLNSNSGWCVIDASTNDTNSQIKISGFDKREQVREIVKRGSNRLFEIASPSYEVSNLKLYVRDKR